MAGARGHTVGKRKRCRASSSAPPAPGKQLSEHAPAAARPPAWRQAENQKHVQDAARTMMSTLHVRLSRTVQLPKKSSHLPGARCSGRSGTGQQHVHATALHAVSRGRGDRAPRERHIAGTVVASAPCRRWRDQGQVVVRGGLGAGGERLGPCAQHDGQAASTRGGPHRFDERPLRCGLCS